VIGLLVGAMLPYWFSAMTMKSVGSAALKMVEEVRRQFNTIPPSRKECLFASLLIPWLKTHLCPFCIRVRSPQPSRPMMSLLMLHGGCPHQTQRTAHAGSQGAHWVCEPVLIGAVWQISPLPGRETTQQQHLGKICTHCGIPSLFHPLICSTWLGARVLHPCLRQTSL